MFQKGCSFREGLGNKPTGECGDTSLEKSLARLPRVLSNALHPMLCGYGLLFKGVMFHAAIEGLLQYKEKTEKYPNGFE